MEHEGRILLCRRGIEPCIGQWTVPAGFLELTESTAGAASSLLIRLTADCSRARCQLGHSMRGRVLELSPLCMLAHASPLWDNADMTITAKGSHLSVKALSGTRCGLLS